MDADSAQLLRFLQSSNQFTVPIYQRKYSWSEKQCKRLLMDIEQIAENQRAQGHFTGSIVYITNDIYSVSGVPKLQVIDGQQRLTTVSLLLLAIKHTLDKNPERAPKINADKLKNQYLINPNESDNELVYKLLLTSGDREVFCQLLDEPEEVDFTKDNLVLNNYQFFMNQLERRDLEKIYQGLAKLMIIDVSLEVGKDDPQLIFESLNSTGLDLSQSDLIRNFLLMGLAPEEQASIYKKYWQKIEMLFNNMQNDGLFDRFSRDYLTIKTGTIPNQNAVYEAFKTYFYRYCGEEDQNVESFVAEYYQYSKFFIALNNHSTISPALNKVMEDINMFTVNVAYPFLMRVYKDFIDKIITEEEIIKLFKFIESYVLRRNICGIPTNSLNKIFATMQIDKEYYVESILWRFIHFDSYQRFPDDEEFVRELLVKDLYNFRRSKYVLQKLENLDSKEIVDISNYTIEHVMPQTLSKEWKNELGDNWQQIQNRYLHTLGNLTLTKYNSEYSNLTFKEKKKMPYGFADSPLRLNHEIAMCESWNEVTIQQRAKKLAEQAANIWPYPNVSKEYKKLRESEGLAETRSVSSYEYATPENINWYRQILAFTLSIDNQLMTKFNQNYIAIRKKMNIISIIFRSKGLIVELGLKAEMLYDPEQRLEKISDIGHAGTGKCRMRVTTDADLNYLFPLIQQTYDLFTTN
ncbi:DUF262 domain-containing protein [Erwinia sp. CPCC 100877]|nr:DUF262 domain-containing protein [Erwinia sp. CPCC 100877]